MLQANDKLEEAMFFLQRMREALPDEAAFKYDMSAFLSRRPQRYLVPPS